MGIRRIETNLLPDTQPGIVVREIGSGDDRGGHIPPSYRHASLFVIDGLLEADVDGTQYRLQRGAYLDCFGSTVCVQCVSTDAHAFLLLLTEEYVGEVLKGKRPFSLAYILRIIQNPLVQVPASAYPNIIRSMENLRQATASSSCRFSQEILQSKVLIFLLELSNLLEGHDDSPHGQELSTYQKHFTAFLHLLPMHIRREHTVAFYAGQLNITPQYLRRIVKELTGRNVYQVICDFLNREIHKLLLETNLTLQEIADELNFSDQATLSKFFKRNNRISPLKYRNDHR